MVRFPVLAVSVVVVLLLFANAPGQSLPLLEPAVASPMNALELAEHALASRDGLASPAGLARERANFATASSVLATFQEPDLFARTIALAQEGTRAQAWALHLPWTDAILPVHASPSEAARALLAAHQATLTSEQEQALLALDVHPEPVHGALTHVFDAFVALDSAAQHAAASDKAPVFPARNALLTAIAALRAALEAAPTTPATAACNPVAVPPVFSVDVATCNNTYAENVALLLDVGGDDVYLNNAGGSRIVGTGCSFPPNVWAASALIDLGGNDRYVSGRDCGVNGGGYRGVGFLVDTAGNDTYTAGLGGTNGGGEFGGVGFLLDQSGDDTYTAGGSSDFGTNGGGSGGMGLLLDAGGRDTYLDSSTNCIDCTVVPKGFVGAQVDSSDSPR